MSAPLPDYNHQMLAYLQIWRDILEKAATATAALAANMAFTPPSMPFLPPGMPPMMPGTPQMPPAPAVAPAPLDYAQQLFSNLQTWRQYLEQLAASPGPAQPSPAPAASANASGGYPTNDGAGASSPAYPHLNRIPPSADDLSRGGYVERKASAATSASEPELPVVPTYEGVSASPPASRYATNSRMEPPYLVAGAPRSPGGSQIPGGSNALLGAAPEPPARPVPPIFDDLNQAVPPGLRYDLGGPAAGPARPAWRPSPTAPALHPAGSPFLAAMGRVAPDAAPQVKAQTRFKNFGQTPTP
jgi:hypothetical protein